MKFLSIYYFACLSVCPLVLNKRQNGWTDRDNIFCGTSCSPRAGLCMIEFSKFASIKVLFLKILKTHEIYLGNRRNFVCYWFYNVHKRTIKIEDVKA